MALNWIHSLTVLTQAAAKAQVVELKHWDRLPSEPHKHSIRPGIEEKVDQADEQVHLNRRTGASVGHPWSPPLREIRSNRSEHFLGKVPTHGASHDPAVTTACKTSATDQLQPGD